MAPEEGTMFRRSLVLAPILALSVGLPVLGLQTATGLGIGRASAAPLICETGDRYATISGISKTYVVTHVGGVQLAPYTTFSQSVTVAKIDSVTAGINGTVTASAKADFILAAAAASASVTLHASGTSTVQTSISRTWTITNNSSSDREYALYVGTLRVTGQYAYRTCLYPGTAWSSWDYGSWKSWTVRIDGTAMCPRSRYASSTLQYKALVKIGC
jgi:hypothetical protein